MNGISGWAQHLYTIQMSKLLVIYQDAQFETWNTVKFTKTIFWWNFALQMHNENSPNFNISNIYFYT